MKNFHFALLALATALLATGCGDSSKRSSTPETNPADVNNPLVNAKRVADKTVDAAALNQAVQLFNVQEGRLPKDLQELTPKYIAKIPDAPLGYKITYNATSGEVSVVRQ